MDRLRIRCLGCRDDLVGFLDGEAHRLLGEDVHAPGQRREDRLRVQMIRGRHGHHVEVREIAENVIPRGLAEVGAGLVPRPCLEIRLGAFGRRLRAGRHGHQFKLYGREIAGPMVEAHPPELPGDAEALQVGVGTEVNIAAEHAGSREGDFDRPAGWVGGCRRGRHGRREKLWFFLEIAGITRFTEKTNRPEAKTAPSSSPRTNASCQHVHRGVGNGPPWRDKSFVANSPSRAEVVHGVIGFSR